MTNIRNIQNNSFGTIDCEIEHPDYGWIPFTASPDDVEAFGKELHASILAGDHGPIAPYSEPVLTTEEKAVIEREERDSRLLELDAIVANPLRWDDLTSTQKAVLSQYRKDLLDVPQQLYFPDQINWPDKPIILQE